MDSRVPWWQPLFGFLESFIKNPLFLTGEHSIKIRVCYGTENATRNKLWFIVFCWLPEEFGVFISFTCMPSPCCSGGPLIWNVEAFDNLTLSLIIVGLYGRIQGFIIDDALPVPEGFGSRVKIFRPELLDVIPDSAFAHDIKSQKVDVFREFATQNDTIRPIMIPRRSLCYYWCVHAKHLHWSMPTPTHSFAYQ